MTPASVGIIFNDDDVSGKSARKGGWFDFDNVKDAAGDVEGALKKAGFATRVIPLKRGGPGALNDFVSGIKAFDGSVIFNLCEGAFGVSAFEMHVAALLELCGARYTGSGPLTLGLALDKSLTKGILQSRGIMTPVHRVMDEPPARLDSQLKFPLIVKPVKEDASIGIDSGAVVNDVAGLKARVEFITSTFGQGALVEEYIDGREFNIAVLGNGKEARTLPPSEIEFVDFPKGAPRICCYEAKWVEESPFYKKTVPVCPADVPAALSGELASVALRAYRAMGCRDYARVDLRLGKDNRINVIEVNPNPDISTGAGLARAAGVAGLDYHELVSGIVREAASRPAPCRPGRGRAA